MENPKNNVSESGYNYINPKAMVQNFIEFEDSVEWLIIAVESVYHQVDKHTRDFLYSEVQKVIKFYNINNKK